ncbi:aminotransferase class V-fold PLP-dependent enzyme [Parvibaculaceae bacterium PLY_AMNH_Bact1]|nr:aminotransferase class V-fold PLP-dependent enzyme [Parvibaculaceae bacterium PLY_AMNH_Bact1]
MQAIDPSLIPNQRSLFDIPDHIAYLNCAYMSPLLKNAAQAGEQAAASKKQPWNTTSDDFFTESETTRSLFASVVGADVEGISFIPSASYGIAIAAANIPVGEGQEVLVLAEQFPSNIYAWERAADEQGGHIRTVVSPAETPHGPDWTPAILDAITERTDIVALPHCHWTDGALIGLKSVSKKAKSVGAALVLDVSQSLGALPLNLADIDPDFVVAPTYKWLLGPYAMGFLYVAPRWREGRPIEENWLNRKGSEDFAGLVDYERDYQPGARRFDMGERANFQLMPMAKSALQQIADWGIENIAATLQTKTNAIADRAAKFGLTVSAPELRAPHFLGVRFPDGVPDGLLDQLAKQHVYVSLRGTSMRVTPHLYNTDDDVDRLFAALQAVL